MAELGNFNADEHELLDDFSPIPAGDYLAMITESEVKPTKNNKGHYLKLTFEIVDGQFKGRKLWTQLNLDNPNETAVQIAKRELADICRAVNVLRPKDSCELHDLPLVITVKLRKRDDNGEMQNEIKGYASKNQAAKQQENKPAVDSSAPPWARK